MAKKSSKRVAAGKKARAKQVRGVRKAAKASARKRRGK